MCPLPSFLPFFLTTILHQLLHDVGTCWDSPTRLGEIDATDWLAFAVMRRGLMAQDELKELMLKFKMIDVDGSGVVESGQLALFTIFQLLDVDGSDALQLDEVLDAVKRLINLGVLSPPPKALQHEHELHDLVETHFHMHANRFSASKGHGALDYLEFLEFINTVKVALATTEQNSF